MAEYKITGYNKEYARLGVWFDGAPTPEWLWLPINDDGMVPTGDELDQWIMLHKPDPIIERGKIVAKGVKNEDVIIGMVPPPPAPPAPDPEAEKKFWAEMLEPIIIKILREYKVIPDKDPSEL